MRLTSFFLDNIQEQWKLAWVVVSQGGLDSDNNVVFAFALVKCDDKKESTPSWTASLMALSVFLSLVQITPFSSIRCRVDWVTEDVVLFFLLLLWGIVCINDDKSVVSLKHNLSNYFMHSLFYGINHSIPCHLDMSLKLCLCVWEVCCLQGFVNCEAKHSHLLT